MNPKEIKYQVSYAVTNLQLQDMKEASDKFVKTQLAKRFTTALTHKFPIKKQELLESDSILFSIDLYCATEKEFWQCVRDEAQKMKEYEKRLLEEG